MLATFDCRKCQTAGNPGKVEENIIELFALVAHKKRHLFGGYYMYLEIISVTLW